MTHFNTPRPFGRKLPELAITTQVGDVLVVALPRDTYQPRTATSPAWGGFDLWFIDTRGQIDSITPALSIPVEAILTITRTLRETDLDLHTTQDARRFLTATLKDTRQYGTRLREGYHPKVA